MPWIVTGVLLFSSLARAQSCPKLPDSPIYNLKQVFFTFGSDFRLRTMTGQPAGQIIEKIFRWGTSFELRNPEGQLVARARKHVFSFGVKVDVFDCMNRPIGHLHEKILQSLLGVVTTYSVKDADMRTIGRSRKTDFISTDFVFYDDSSRVVAEAHRPWFNFLVEKWTVAISQPSVIDARLMLFTPAFKTAADAARAAQRAARNSRDYDDDGN